MKKIRFEDVDWNKVIEARERWRAIGTCTEPADRETAEKAVCKFYELLGAKKPEIIWLDGPMSAVWLTPILRGMQLTLDKLHNQLAGQLDNQLGIQLDNQLYNQLRVQLRNHLTAQLEDQLDNQLDYQLANRLANQLRAQLTDQLYNRLTDHFGQLDGQLHNQLTAQLNNQLRDQLDNQLYDQLGDRMEADGVLQHLRGHDTHEQLDLPRGIWEVRRQREWTPEGERRALD